MMILSSIAGWLRVPVTGKVLLVLAAGLLLVLPVYGASRQRPPAVPDPELIEFLGSFVTADGKSVDPLVFTDQEQEKRPAAENRKPREQQQKMPVAKPRRETEGTDQ